MASPRTLTIESRVERTASVVRQIAEFAISNRTICVYVVAINNGRSTLLFSLQITLDGIDACNNTSPSAEWDENSSVQKVPANVDLGICDLHLHYILFCDVSCI